MIVSRVIDAAADALMDEFENEYLRAELVKVQNKLAAYEAFIAALSPWMVMNADPQSLRNFRVALELLDQVKS